PPHHPALRLTPILATSQQPDVGPLQHRGQVPVLRLVVPERGAFRQPQLGPAATGLALLAGQPLTQRVDQVVVGELIVPRGERRGLGLDEGATSLSLIARPSSRATPSRSVGVIRRSSWSRMRTRSSKSRG